MINYEIDPALISKSVPRGTEVDLWNGRCLVSLVGFLFSKTKVKGIPVPFHRNFEEINLRYYIKRVEVPETKRAVGFVKEIVPHAATAWLARKLYNENYVACPMDHRLEFDSGPSTQAFARGNELIRSGGSVEYGWREGGQRHSLCARRGSEYQNLQPGSEQEFIAEHYWGYVSQRNGETVEYRVNHTPWRVAEVSDVTTQIDLERVYGREWVGPLSQKPLSAFLANGSEVTVMDGTQIEGLEKL